jgi:class 3 adenylate cyclase/tetratricopeptide (TPR) repeat protein
MAACTCGEALPPGARFCPACGLPAHSLTCASCGAELPEAARFCMACGTAVAHGSHPAPATSASGPAIPVSSRRVTSVLFADLVAFTTLAETRDTEDVRELLSRYFEECQQVIARYGGTIEKFIGDAVMAVWGVPIAHEDDAERAVRAGLELVAVVSAFGEERRIPELALRVGIVTGEVAVTVGAENQGMVAGDAVNTAARVQAAASGGQVWVDENTRLLTAAAISYADMGSHQLKGKADPVPLWSARAVVAAVGGAQRADGLEAPLAGRDRELRLVKELFHRCEESREPTLLVVAGEAGVGKSRLAWEFEKYVDGLTRNVRWHSGRCIAYGEGVAFFALAEAVRGRLGTLAGTDPGAESQRELLERGLEEHVPDPQERDWLRPRVGALLGIGSVGSFPREDLFAAWCTFFERVGGDDPVILVIDDAEHADDGFVHFLEHLVSVAGFGCFVVLLTRPGLLEVHPALATNSHATVMHLPALGARDMANLVDGLVVGLSASDRDQLVRRSEGLPLFAVETVRSLIDRDLVVPRGGQYVLRDPDALRLDELAAPASLQALVSARLDTLSQQQRALVDRASVLGGSFAPEAIIALCPEIPDPTTVLEDLVRLQILSRETSRMSADFGHYRFVQEVVRQVALGTLSRHDRKTFHLAVIAHFDREGLDGNETAAIRAQHYLEAARAVPDAPDVPDLQARARATLRQAAARAAALGATREAVGHLTAALALTTDDQDVSVLARELAQVECDAGLYEDAIRHAEQAEAAALAVGNRVDAGHAAGVRGQALMDGRGELELTEATLRPWWEELRQREDADAALLRITETLVSALARQGSSRHDVIEHRLLVAERVGDVGAIADAYNSLAIHYDIIGLRGLVGVLMRASHDLAREHHHPRTLGRALINLTAAAQADDLDTADRYGREAVKVSDRAGLAMWSSLARANLVGIRYWTGHWEAMDELPTARPGEEDLRTLMIVWSTFAAMRAEATGDQAPVPEPHIAAVDQGDDPADLSWAMFARAVNAAATGDLETAVRLGTESVELCLSYAGFWDDLVHLWSWAARTALDAEDLPAVDRLLGPVRGSGQLPNGLIGHRAQIEGLVAARHADVVRADAQLRAAIAAFQQWVAPTAIARAEADLGALLHAHGREEAAKLISSARAQFTRLGARQWLADLDTALETAVPAGVRPPISQPGLVPLPTAPEEQVST